MNQKIWVSIVAGLAAVSLLACLAMGLAPSAVSAADYSEAEEEPDERSEALVLNVEDTPYGPYEMMTQEQRITYVKIQQFQQQWRQQRAKLAYEGTNTEEPLRHVNPVNSRLAVSPEELQRIEESTWHCPLTVDTFVSSPFGMRLHPVLGYYRMHNGVDLDSDRGDEIVAARGGTVIASGYSSSAGYYVKIDHGDGFVTEYFHMSRRAVEKGDVVQSCDIIGYVGSTGISSGAHLHFGMLFEDEYVDPEDYIEF